MAAIDWKKSYLANTASSYANFATKMLTGLLVYAAVFKGFSDGAFDLWVLLWSFISYSIVLDFGMGFTIQRLVATKASEGKMEEVDGLFTTAFWTFIGMGILSFALAVLGTDLFLNLFIDDISEGERVDFKLAYTYFFAGVATLLPIGLFPAALTGIQRQYWFNWFSVGCAIAYWLVVTRAIEVGAPLSQIVLISILFTVIPYVLCAIIAIPMFKVITLNPMKYDLSAVREQLRFSLMAYFTTCNNMLLNQSDKVVVGGMLPDGAMKTYSPGAKVAEILNGVAMQIMNVVPTAAAHLHASGGKEPLRELYFNTNRLLLMVTTPCYLLAMIFMDELLAFITNTPDLGQTVSLMGYIILTMTYFSHLTSSAADRVLMMCGHEKVILRFSVCRFLSNVVLSVLLAIPYGIIGVALGGLISVCIVNVGLLLPPVLRFLEVGFVDYLTRHVRRLAIPLCLFLVLLVTVKLSWPFPDETPSQWMMCLHLAIRSAIIMIPTLILLRKEITSTWKS
ncbi:MATE family efflux transporter [Verrucomicrobiales bacterium]|jgi:O-antigen/teichoic acid export membrane protein|nr:MATE family efflux transporter [Verrucomicrobiales bacterium]MDB4467685.1 MATE family efflux transporter [Verrucomicrobiales bacterium]